MNQQLTELAIRNVCRELKRERGRVSGRALRAELQARYGAVGKTSRVFAIWREEFRRLDPAPSASSPGVAGSVAELSARVLDAETRAAAALERAQKAELREEAHQAHWALEIDRLREELRAQPRHAQELQRLQLLVNHLRAQIASLRGRDMDAG